MSKVFYVTIVVFVLSSCADKKKKILNGDLSNGSPFAYDARQHLEQELAHKQPLMLSNVSLDPKFLDIPIPLDTFCIIPSFGSSVQSDDESISDGRCNEQVMYSSLLDRAFLVHFFNEQMEAFDWQKEGTISSFEDTLIFSKVHKKAFISLRTGTVKKGKTIIVISIFENKGNPLTHYPYSS